MISPDGSCRNAVMRLLAFRASRREKPCAPRTGSYCKARKRLPQKILSRLTQETAARMTGETPERWRWHFRQGERLSKCERRVEWTRPKQQPRWLSKRAYRRMPETLTLRLIRVDVEQLGFRT